LKLLKIKISLAFIRQTSKASPVWVIPIEDCLYKAKGGINEYIDVLKEQGLSIPTPNTNPTVLIQNEQHLESISR